MKALLAPLAGTGRARGATLLTYHRVGGGTTDELDTPVDQFEAQLDALDAAGNDVVALDVALDRLEVGDARPCVVLTFDDGFADLYTKAWPRLRERELPFTVFLVAGMVGATMRWEGSAAVSQGAPALRWDQLDEMADSGLCTVANHTYSHPRPSNLDAGQLDRCSDAIEARLGARPRHFAYPWGVPVPAARPEVEARFRSAAIGRLGRNRPGGDPFALRRVPVRRTDPIRFFEAKLTGSLLPERTYGLAVRSAKRLRRRHG